MKVTVLQKSRRNTYAVCDNTGLQGMIDMKKDRTFYQAKFEYYRNINKWLVIVISISSLFYTISDWYLFGQINLITVPARTAILIPFAVFMAVNAKVNDYRIIVPLSYLVGHSVMWCTIGACIFLPDLTFASDGFIIIMAIFILLGFAAPYKWSIVLTGLIFADIAVANTFLHYPEFAMMLILGIPFYVGICVIDWAIERTYLSQYEAKKQLEENAYHDQLTGIYNRNIMDSIIDEKKCFRCFGGKNLCVQLMDIDLFKHVNDTYGHEGGDVVLKEIVKLAVSQTTDVPNYMIRWGGEEFLLITQESPAMAVNRAEKIRRIIETQARSVCPVTVSIGVTIYEGGDYNHAVQKADQALYIAKNSGRNQVYVEESMQCKI